MISQNPSFSVTQCCFRLELPLEIYVPGEDCRHILGVVLDWGSWQGSAHGVCSLCWLWVESSELP